MSDLPVQDTTTRPFRGRSPDLFPDFKWNDENIAYLKQAWIAGDSALKIAEHIQSSRCSVIGKVDRLGLGARSRDIARNALDKSLSGGFIKRVKAKPRTGGNTVLRINDKAGQPSWVNIGLEAFNATIPVAQRVTIEGLTHTTCRWPCGDPATPEFFYCGALEADNREGRPYCQQHAGFAFTGKSSAKPWLAGRP